MSSKVAAAVLGTVIATATLAASRAPEVQAPAATAQALAPNVPPPGTRPRVIVLTDGEIDDRDSMIRFLMYANEWDVEGLIYTSSRFHWLGNAWAGAEWISDEIDLYSRVYPSLRRNADGYPTPDELRSKTYVGNITNVGEMEADSPGADRIVRVLLDDKPGPVYLQAWGGTNTLAKALSTIKKEHPDQVDRVSRKAVLFLILDQDTTFRQYVEPNWPKLTVLGSFRQFGVLAFGWRTAIPAQYRPFFERPWLEGHISSDHGSLAGAYLSDNTGAFRSEGDSPSFMHQIEVGLRSLENPSYGGWGGRFVPEKPDVTAVWKDAEDDGSISKPIWRWAEAFQNDWAARADWCVKPYEQANHPPIVVLAGARDLEAAPGATVDLNVSGSTDPDGNRLFTSWWVYRDPSTHKGDVAIKDPGAAVTTLQVPANAKPGDTIHVIAQVTDGGSPPLTRYARVIITVKGAR
jgi:cellulose-binding protein